MSTPISINLEEVREVMKDKRWEEIDTSYEKRAASPGKESSARKKNAWNRSHAKATLLAALLVLRFNVKAFPKDLSAKDTKMKDGLLKLQEELWKRHKEVDDKAGKDLRKMRKSMAYRT